MRFCLEMPLYRMAVHSPCWTFTPSGKTDSHATTSDACGRVGVLGGIFCPRPRRDVQKVCFFLSGPLILKSVDLLE